MRSFIYTLFLINIIFCSSLKSENIDKLLDIYQKENELSKKTKKQKAGDVIIYTRRDLERMQVKSLAELLKTIPYLRYNENQLGYTDLSYYTGTTVLSSDMRVYINEVEVSSPLYGNGLGIISKFDFEYVDHVEIYYQVSTFEFGVEPSNMVIKIYTRDPNRENGGNISTSYSSYGSYDTSVSLAQVLENFSVFAYVNKKITNEKKVKVKNSSLSRDRSNTHLFLSFQNQNNQFQYNRIDVNSDLFMFGVAPSDGTPSSSTIDATYNLLGWKSSFFDNNLNFSLNYIFTDPKTKQVDDTPIGYKMIDDKIVPLYSYETVSKERQLSSVLKYKYQINNHKLLTGVHFRDKKFRYIELKGNDFVFNSELSEVNSYNSEKIFGAFVEDNYKINDKQNIIVSLKHDRAKPNDNKKYHNLLFYRVAYFYKLRNFIFKLNYSSSTSRLDSYYSRITPKNYDYQEQKDEKLSFDFSWGNDKFKNDINLYILRQKNLFQRKTTSTSIDEDLKKPYYMKGVSYTNKFNLNELDYLMANFFIMRFDNKSLNYSDTIYGGNIRLLNSIDKFDFYNELIYKDGYKDVDPGYNYNFAITYNHTKDFAIFFKGENIFDKAIKTRYYVLDSNSIAGFRLSDSISVSTKRFTIGLEYKF